MLRSLTLNEDYFERRNLRIACTQRKPSPSPSSYLIDPFPPQASEILPNLYLTDMYTATHPLTLQRLRITHVVSVVSDPWYVYPRGVNHLCVPVQDCEEVDIGRYFDGVVEWIRRALHSNPSSNMNANSGGGDGDEGGARVLVHCMWGMSRSASIIIAYLMATQGMSLMRSLMHVKAKRSVVRPNRGFVGQLVIYEEKLRHRERVRVRVRESERSTDTSLIRISQNLK